jgi:ATP-binding cassette, subfamily B, bacterial PglK
MIQWAGQAISSVKEITITGRRSFFLDQHAFHVQRFSNSARLLSFLVTLPRFIIDTLSVTALVAIATILLARGQDLQSSLLLLGMFALAAVRMIPSTTRLSAALAQVRFRYASTEVMYRELSLCGSGRPTFGRIRPKRRRPPSRSDRRSRSNMCPIFILRLRGRR